MPAGDELAGSPFSDPILFTADVLIAARPRAIQFDATSRNFLLDATGRYIDQDPTDARVDLAMLFLLGRLKAAPQIGWSIDKIRDFASEGAKADADRRARAALAPLINSGAITYKGLLYDPHQSGPAAAVLYINNSVSPRPQTPTALYLR